MSTRRRRMRYQPSKGKCIFAGIVGIFFCLVGFTVVLPGAGIFGLVWTAIAVAFTVNSFRMAAGKKSFMGSYVIEEENSEGETSGEQSVEGRLKALQSLYDQRLITTEEYENMRQEILKEL